MSWNEAKRWLHNFRNQNSTSSFSSSRTLLVTLPLRRCTNILSYITWFNREKLFKCSLLLHTLSTMNKCWFFDFFKGFANRNRKKYTKRGTKRETLKGKSMTQYKKETIHDATRFFNLVLRVLSSRFSFYRWQMFTQILAHLSSFWFCAF